MTSDQLVVGLEEQHGIVVHLRLGGGVQPQALRLVDGPPHEVGPVHQVELGRVLERGGDGAKRGRRFALVGHQREDADAHASAKQVVDCFHARQGLAAVLILGCGAVQRRGQIGV